jgi:hypothetical protein
MIESALAEARGQGWRSLEARQQYWAFRGKLFSQGSRYLPERHAERARDDNRRVENMTGIGRECRRLRHFRP